jgi:hemerythrin-like domain-containing protein
MAIAMSPDLIEGRLLEDEHRRVRAGLAAIRDALDEAHDVSRSGASYRTARALAWLRRDLLPHVAWEEAWLYPELDAIAATPWATRALRLEHEQIRDVARRLEVEFRRAEEQWSAQEAFSLAIALARLETLISAHLAKEQWIVQPLLDQAEVDRAAHPQEMKK